jgi:hypothetical protein
MEKLVILSPKYTLAKQTNHQYFTHKIVTSDHTTKFLFSEKYRIHTHNKLHSIIYNNRYSPSSFHCKIRDRYKVHKKHYYTLHRAPKDKAKIRILSRYVYFFPFET